MFPETYNTSSSFCPATGRYWDTSDMEPRGKKIGHWKQALKRDSRTLVPLCLSFDFPATRSQQLSLPTVKHHLSSSTKACASNHGLKPEAKINLPLYKFRYFCPSDRKLPTNKYPEPWPLFILQTQGTFGLSSQRVWAPTNVIIRGSSSYYDSFASSTREMEY